MVGVRTRFEEIAVGIAQGESGAVIGRRLGRACSAIAREIARNGGHQRYRASAADRRALDQARRPEQPKLARCARLRREVEERLGQRWSPCLPERWARSLTWDQGKEMADHAKITSDTGVPICFCRPSCPPQRGTNENTNGLLRQYLPNRTDLSPISQHELDQIAAELNGRPRRVLEWIAPLEALNRASAMTT